jgi:hypothetical protein
MAELGFFVLVATTTSLPLVWFLQIIDLLSLVTDFEVPIV